MKTVFLVTNNDRKKVVFLYASSAVIYMVRESDYSSISRCPLLEEIYVDMSKQLMIGAAQLHIGSTIWEIQQVEYYNEL